MIHVQFWPKQLVRKWLNMRHNGNQKFDRDFEMDVGNKYVGENGEALSNQSISGYTMLQLSVVVQGKKT